MPDHPAIRIADRILRFLLRAYPPAFRRRLGPDLMEVHRDRCREEWQRRGWLGLTAYWVRAGRLMIRDGLFERLAGSRPARDKPRGVLMHSILQDLRYALRSLRKKPAFATVVVTTLALGIGANAAIFSIVDGVLLRTLPYHQPERLVRIWSVNQETGDRFLEATFADVVAFREQNHSFSEVAAFSIAPRDLNDTYGDPSRATVTRLSRGLFAVLGTSPEHGRDFRPGEYESAERSVVVSHGMWTGRYGGDPNLLGRTIRLQDDTYTVVGIMPRWYDYPNGTDMWRPFTDDEYQDDDRELYVIARLAPGVTIDQATEDVQQVAGRVEQLNPDNHNITAWVQPLHAMLVQDVRTPLMVLLGAVALVLLIACANIANLLLASATAREQEIAVRVALGAGRVRLVRQLLTESLLLAAVGGGAGVLLGRWALDLIIAISPSDTPRIFEVALDGRVIAVMAFVTAVAGIAFGLFPAVQASRPTFLSLLREGGRAGATLAKHRVQRALVVAEIALSTVLVIGAGLLMTTFQRLLDVDRGFATEHVLTVPVHQSEDSEVATREYFGQLLARVRQIPTVQAAAMSTTSPMEPRGFGVGVHIQGTPQPTSVQARAVAKIASPGFFETAGIDLIAGRPFAAGDDRNSEPVIIVNRAFTRTFLDPAADPTQKIVESMGSQFHIVGVIRDLTPEASTAPAPTMYVTSRQLSGPGMTLLIRATEDPTPLIPVIRNLIWELDPQIPLDDITTIEQAIGETVASPRFNMVLVAALASLALLLAAVGIYGVMSYTVAQRTREMGLRQALGAGRGVILREVLGDGLRMAASGVVLGVVGAVMATRLLTSLLYGVSPTDPLTFGIVVVTLTAVAAVACYVPARRATKIDPVDALRSE